MCSLYFFGKTIKRLELHWIGLFGNSEGIISGWKESVLVTKSFFVSSGLVLEVFVKGLNKTFKFLNVYGPYLDKRPNWDRIFQSTIILGPNLIIEGDLNFTLNSREIWGALA